MNIAKLNLNVTRFLRKNSPAILSCLAVVGVVATAVLVAEETPKVNEALRRAEEEKGEDLTAIEKAEIVIPEYAPAIAMGVSTVACVLGASVLNQRKQASLLSAYHFLGQTYKDYRDKNIEVNGAEADKTVRKAIMTERIVRSKVKPDAKVMWYEPISGTTLNMYEKEIIDAEYQFNRMLTARGYVSLNDYYYLFGVPTTKEGSVIGWSICDDYTWVDFEHEIMENDNGLIYSINTNQQPDEGYMEEWSY